MSQELLENIQSQYNEINWSKLLREDLGAFSLKEAEPQINNIKILFDNILNHPNIENFHQQFLDMLNSTVTQFAQFAAQVSTQYNNTAEKNIWLNNVKGQELAIFNHLQPIYNYINALHPIKEVDDDELKASWKERSAIINSNFKKSEEKLKKIEEILARAQGASVGAETLKYGNFFGAEAEKNKKSAQIYFWVMMSTVFLTAFIAILFLQFDFVKTAGGDFWSDLLATINSQNILLKFAILSLGGYLISHFSKTYSAEKHLYNVNIQKQNALNSHMQMLRSVAPTESENEKEVRNLILLELTKAIFETKDTGYIKNSSDKSSININPSIKA